MQPTREINSNIFPRPYTFPGTYPKSFTIFGPLHNSIFKFKYQTFLNKKEKEKCTVQCWRPARTRPKTAREFSRADRVRCGPSFSLTRTLTGGTRPSGASPTSRHGSGELRLNAGELPTSAVRRASFPGPLRTCRPSLHSLSPILAPAATSMAGGRLGRAHTGRSKRVERKVSGVRASVAHRDFNEARISSEEARSDAGHGGVLAAALGRSCGRKRLGLELR